MDVDFIEAPGGTLAEAKPGSVIGSIQDAVDLVGTAAFGGASHLVLHEDSLPADFFDLSSGVAGEILQKCVNYRLRVIVVASFAGGMSASLAAFVAESNRGRHVRFVPDRAAALASLGP